MSRKKSKDPTILKARNAHHNKRKGGFFKKAASLVTLAAMGMAGMLRVSPKAEPKRPKTEFDFKRLEMAQAKRDRKAARDKALANPNDRPLLDIYTSTENWVRWCRLRAVRNPNDGIPTYPRL